jgi:hypothetical protein
MAWVKREQGITVAVGRFESEATPSFLPDQHPDVIAFQERDTNDGYDVRSHGRSVPVSLLPLTLSELTQLLLDKGVITQSDIDGIIDGR